jgi:hypothetical protein
MLAGSRSAMFMLAMTMAVPAAACEFNEKVSLGGVASWAGQCQNLHGDGEDRDHCRGPCPSSPN